MARKPATPIHPLLTVAARGAAGVHPVLIVRIRPATLFERATWDACPPDGMRVHVDEDGTMKQNIDLVLSCPGPPSFLGKTGSGCCAWRFVLRGKRRQPRSDWDDPFARRLRR